MGECHARVLGVIAELDNGEGGEVDEFRVARRCEMIPKELRRNAYFNHPDRARVLSTLNELEGRGLIYIVKSGHWGLHLTRAGRASLAAPDPAMTSAPPTMLRPVTLHAVERSAEPMAWEGPLPEPIELPPGRGGSANLPLTAAVVGIVLLFVLTALPPRLLAERGVTVGATPTAVPVLVGLPAAPPAPSPPIPTPTIVATIPTPAPAPRPALVVANTGGDGVYLRRSPRLGDRLTAWPDSTRMEEIGPETTVDGVTWRRVRAPNGAEGFVPARYVVEAP